METEPTKKTIEDLEIQDIAGIGPTTAKKLKDAGITTVMDLAAMSVEELALHITNKDTAMSYIVGAQKLLQELSLLDNEFMKASVILDKRKGLVRLDTGSKALNNLLLGGIETGSVTEFFGEFGSGKSQICHTLAVLATLPVEEGGLNGNVIYIDTESTFRPERIEQIAAARGLNAAEILDKITVCKAYSSAHLEVMIKNISKYINEFKAKLVIVDSIIALHRADFTGRGTLSDRQQRLNTMISKIKRVTDVYNIAFVFTNQVQSSPDLFAAMDPIKATGGNIIGHASTYRIYLKKSKENRLARMIDSPYHPYSDTKFTINEKGVDDMDEKVK